MKISIPMPLQIVIEDVGWWSGTDGSRMNQPFRTAMNRRHVPEDYDAIVSLGRKLGMRPQAAFVACEWDRENILKQVPTATWMGEAWDNRLNVGPWLDRAADIIRTGREHIELALHGVGHEYWADGRLSRSEFHTRDGEMRCRRDIERHLDCFERILGQNGLGSFPESFVPPALNHSFGNGDDGFQNILAGFGGKFVTTIFKRAAFHSPAQYERLAWESGVTLVERGESPAVWSEISATPAFAFDRPV